MRGTHLRPTRSSRAGALSALALLGLLAAAAGCAHARPGAPLDVGPAARLDRAGSSRVVVIVMENREATEVLGNPEAPYTNALIRRYALARSSFAIAHPSLPNYLALTGGSTAGISSDCTSCHVAAPNIVDQLEAAGISWKAYLEDVPGPCFRGAGSGDYAKKHNPFIYYDDIAGSPKRCGRLVGFDQLARDLRGGRLPSFAWVTPNLCDDGHDCSLSTADRFLARTVPLLQRALGPRGFLVLTWDEGSSDAGCCGAAHGGRIVTAVVGPGVRPGARLAAPVDHYGVLGTIEQAFGLPALAHAGDPHSGRLASLFVSPPQVTAAASRVPREARLARAAG